MREALGRVIVRVANGFSTKTAIFVALVWSLLPFAFPAWQTAILYVSAGIVQLVALPLLAWQNAQQMSAHDEVRASHDDLHRKIDRLHAHLGVDPEETTTHG